jgi:protein O-mannosyl-transferase
MKLDMWEKTILRKLNIERLGRPAFICLWLALVTVLVYVPVFQAQFIGYDDPDYVTSNPHVLSGVTLANLRWAFVTSHTGNWHPVTWISLMLNSQYFGSSAGAFHAVNVLLHVANTLLLFLWLYGATGAKWRGALVAALFALHPLHVESVAWISERKDVLSTLLWMLTLFVYTEYAKSGRIASYSIALLLFGIGLMAKPMLVSLPFVLLLLDYWPLGRFAKHRTFRLLIEKLPFFAFSIASSVVTLVVQRQQTMTPLNTLPIFLRAQNAVLAYVTYIGKMFRPTGLAVIYPYNLHLHPSPIHVLLSLATLVIVSVAAILIRREKPYLFTGWSWFLLTLAPTIGIAQVGLQSMADRYTYIPLIGLFVIVAWGGWEALNLLRIRPFAQALVASIALVLCATLARAQLRYWHDSITLFQHAADVTVDNGVAEANLGLALAEQGHYDEAIGHYKTALHSEPRATIWNNLGQSLVATGKLEEAVNAFQNALKLNPSLGRAHHNLALALARTGRQQESLVHFGDAARLEAENASVHNNYAMMLGRAGRTDEAIQEFQMALRLAPNVATTHFNLANLLAQQHVQDEAMTHYLEALRLNPAFLDAHCNIASLLLEKGRTKDAAAHYIAALKAKPNYLPAMVSVAWIYATASDEAGSQHAAEAVRLAKQACQISGCKQSGVLDTLAAAYANAGRFEDAIKTGEEAFSVAKAAGENNFADSIRARIDLYKKGSPFRDAK